MPGPVNSAIFFLVMTNSSEERWDECKNSPGEAWAVLLTLALCWSLGVTSCNRSETHFLRPHSPYLSFPVCLSAPAPFLSLPLSISLPFTSFYSFYLTTTQDTR